jgi:hypothetical protein
VTGLSQINRQQLLITFALLLWVLFTWFKVLPPEALLFKIFSSALFV